MDPLAGIAGTCVILSWSRSLVRDTGAILLDMVPDRGVAHGLRQIVGAEGDRVADFHLRRLETGHLGAILSVVAVQSRGPAFYRAQWPQMERQAACGPDQVICAAIWAACALARRHA